jgi:hypothetical protein
VLIVVFLAWDSREGLNGEVINAPGNWLRNSGPITHYDNRGKFGAIKSDVGSSHQIFSLGHSMYSS